MKKYQVAIIGTNIGAKHYEDFQKVKGRFNVHTLCGLTREAIDNILSKDTETKVSLNFDDVLKEKEIDIIDICLPPHLHFSACKKAMEAGKHVICEKPLVSSLKEVDELEKISKETGKIIFPVSSLIFSNSSTSFRLETNGFSQITCFPASIAFLQAEKCKCGGRHISMISMSFTFKTSSKLSDTFVSVFFGKILSIASPVSPHKV